ncbi:uncharacterized protein [Prorops nasuta]|uniref:uncharacterized protein isoform X2 n=1 Tax=Prorops nasuta TaxID=863751 RepID=UPI0034CE533C
MLNSVKILDGGFSAQLGIYVGAKIDGDPLWTARFLSTNPEAVYKTHLDFLRAGADIIETNTYQASISGLTKHLGISESESSSLLCKAVQLAKKAVETYKGEIVNNDKVFNNNPLIAGSCGPYGASLHDYSEYTGSYGKRVSQVTIKEYHRPRIVALIEGGVDLLAMEMIPCIEEAEAIIDLLKEFPQIKAWMSFSIKPDSQSLVDGSSFKQVATRCYKMCSQLIAVGANCLAPKDVTKLFKTIVEDTNEQIPLIVYPNSGEIYSLNKGWTKADTLDQFQSLIPEWLNLGVKYIGGCCRVCADDITYIRETVNTWEREKALTN